MDPITLALLAGLAAGVGGAAGEAADQSIVEAYGTLRGLLARTLGPDSAVMKAVQDVEDHPEYAWRVRALEGELVVTGVDQDPAVLAAAQELIDKVRAQPGGDGILERAAAGPSGAGSGPVLVVMAPTGPYVGRSVTGHMLEDLGFDAIEEVGVEGADEFTMAEPPEAGDVAEAAGPPEEGARAEPSEPEPGPEPEAGLRISQWLRNGEGETLGMASRVHEPEAYWYAVEIGRRARAGASTQEFEEPEELKQTETAFVAVEVESPLVAGGREQRWVEYRRGDGFSAQFFQLLPQGKAGCHPLTVSLVHGNRVVYRHQWSIDVGDDEQDRAAEPDTTTTRAELGEVYSTPYRLVAKAEAKRLGLMPPKMGMADGQIMTDKRGLQDVWQTKARKLLKEYSEARRGGAALDRAEVAALLRAMAVWGSDAKRLLLGEHDEDNALVRRMLSWMKPGDGLLIETDIPSFPWEWIYDGERPPVAEELDDAGLKELVKGFWGVRYDLEFLPDIDLDRMDLEEHRARAPETAVLAAVNRSAHPVEGEGSVSDLEELGTRGHVGVEVLIESTSKVVEWLRRPTKANVYYFYCHHKAGNVVDAYGFLRPEDSALYLKGDKGEELTVENLKDAPVQPFPPKEAPLVILNACGTAQGADYVPSGFVRYFLTDLNAAAVVGTVAEVPAGDARAFGKQLLERWLGGATVGRALLDLRHEWMLDAEVPNPFALYYTLHGSGEAKLDD